MKKIFFILSIAILPYIGHAQGVGLSFSYFVPQSGVSKAPIVPISLNDISLLSLGKIIGLRSSISLYTIGSMDFSSIYQKVGSSLNQLPIEFGEPPFGPFNSLVITLTPQIRIPIGRIRFKFHAGVFLFYNFNPELIKSSFDNALASYKNWSTLSSDLDLKNRLGIGFIYGGSVTYFVIDERIGITGGINFYKGKSNIDLSGTYSGTISGSSAVIQVNADYRSILEYTGAEVIVGLVFILRKN